MRAVLAGEGGSGEPLLLGEAPVPEIGPEDVLIRVAATAVNRADLLQRAGNYPSPPGESPILGLEVSGRIEAVGAAVEDWKPGDRTMTIVASGAYAALCRAPAAALLPIPDRFDLVTAAAIPEAFLTAYLNIFREAGLRQNEVVLIHGGASGVGTAAIQLCRHLREADVFVTVGSDAKADACRALGAQHTILYKIDDFAAKVRDSTDGGGANVILDHVGGGYLKDNMRSLDVGGRLVIIGLMGGAKAELNIGAMMVKRQRIIGSVLRSRPVMEKAELSRAFSQEALPLLADGRIEPVIHTTLGLDAVNEAHEIVASNQNIGKVLMVVDDSLEGS